MRSRFAASAPLARSGKAPSVRFSSTVRSPKMPRSSGTRAMPFSTISWGGRAAISSPLIRMLHPGRAGASPAMLRISVLLPAPFAPSMTTISSAPTVTEASSTA